MPVRPKKATSPRLAANSWRACSESARRAIAGRSFAAGNGESVTAATDGFDRLELAFGVELLAQSTDEHLEHVRVAVEILLVDVLGQVGLGDELARVQHQVLEDL